MSKLDLQTLSRLVEIKGQMYLANDNPKSDYEARKEMGVEIAKKLDEKFATPGAFAPDEFEITSAPSIIDPHMTIYTALWRPVFAGYTDAELHGGPCDGFVIPDGRTQGSRFVAKYEKPVGETGFEVDPTVGAVDYYFDGWNPETKKWIYQAERNGQL